MEYVMLVTDNKEIITTKRIPIYSGEKNTDKFKFLFPSEMIDTTPTLQIILPDGVTGKIKPCAFEEDLYKERLVTYVDITEELTAYSGNMVMWFTIFGNSQDTTMKTDMHNVNIMEHKGFTAVHPESDIDIVESITELKNAVNLLKNNKADDLKLDNETNKLQLQSNGKTIAEVELPDDVTWEIIE